MNVARFNTQLRVQGQDMQWERACRCPCADPQDGSPSATCPVCRARGWFWENPRPARAALSGMKIQREWANFGSWESGDVVVSVGSDTSLYGAGETDRVTFTQSSEAFDDVRRRGSANERLLFSPSSIDRCFWLDDFGSTIIEGGIPDVAADGSLSWRAGRLAPPAGRQYTLRGRRRPIYFLFKDWAQDRAHYGGLKLPRRLVLRKFDLFGR